MHPIKEPTIKQFEYDPTATANGIDAVNGGPADRLVDERLANVEG